MEQRTQQEADQRRRQRQMPSTLVDTDVSTPHNLNQYNINWSSFEVQGFELPRQSQQYIQAIACACRFGIQRGILLEHDYGSDRGLCTWDNPNPELLYPYYLLTSQDLTVKDAPLPSRENQMLFWAHATTVGGLHSILKFRNMAPMEAHNVPNNNTFYAIGHPMCGGPEDDWSIARVIHNAAASAKNVAQVIVCGTAWGSLAKISWGSWVTSVKATEDDQVYRDKNGKAYVISRNRYNIAEIAYAATMNPPSTAATLLHEYARASGQNLAHSSRAAAALINR